MLMNGAICAVLAFIAAKVLNSTVFKSKPASRLAAFWLSVVVFVINVVVIRYLQEVNYQAILEQLGTNIQVKNQFYFGIAAACSFIFFSLLRKKQQNVIKNSNEN